MYNESAKQRFLSEYIGGEKVRAAATEKALIRIFNAIEQTESDCNTDFVQMELADMQKAFDAASGIRSQSAESTYFLLKQYVRWCVSNGIATSDAFSCLRLESVEKYRATAVAAPHHLKSSLDIAFPSPDRNEIEYIYRAALWLAFIGFDDMQAITVTSEDIDFQKMHIRREGLLEPLLIYSEASPDLRKACSLTEFIEPRGKNGVVKQREVGDLVLRGKVSNKTMEEFMITTMRQTIARAFKAAVGRYYANGDEPPRNISLSLSYDRVYRSGICYRAYENERVGISPLSGFEAMTEIELNRKLASGEYKTGAYRTRNKIRSVILKRYLDEYALWKCAFTT